MIKSPDSNISQLHNGQFIEPENAVECYINAFSNDSSSMIANIQTQVVDELLSNKVKLPTTINFREYENSYVCSPYTALVPYCMEELNKLDNRFLRTILSSFVPLIANTLKKYKINQVVHVNNWMLSTNLYPDAMQKSDLKLLTESLIEKYPSSAIAFRSLNYFSNSELIVDFMKQGYIMLPTRQVYIYAKNLKDYSKSHNYKIDKKLFQNTPYNFVRSNEISIADYPRIIELYNQLYLNKYSKLNPQFTEKYIEMIMTHPNFCVEGFRNSEGILDAVGGRFTIDGTTTLPLVGYDTSKPQKLGLYRLVLIATLMHAENNGLVFNASSGAPDFKRLRGASPFIEYSAIYIRHLPVGTQRLWKSLAFLLKRLFVPIMKKYQL